MGDPREYGERDLGDERPRVYDPRDRDEQDPRDGLMRDLDLVVSVDTGVAERPRPHTDPA